MEAWGTTLVWLTINTIKWTLILFSATNVVLAWKIFKRRNLHTIFNLSMCFYFLCCGALTPILIYNYFNLLDKKMRDPGAACLECCRQIFIIRKMLYQPFKVFIINILYRLVKMNFEARILQYYI